MAEKTNSERFIDAFLATWEVLRQDGREPTELTITAYQRALCDLPIDETEAAFSRLIASWKYPSFPKPADVRDAAMGTQQQIEDVAHLESAKVIKAVRGIGCYASVVFDDPVTAAVIHEGFGGWVRLCDELNDASAKWFMKDFVAMYQAYRRQNRRYTGKLIGRCEAENIAAGHLEYVPDPVCIGHDGRQMIEN